MANPSSTGSGTEVLRRYYKDGLAESSANLLTVTSNHLFIIKTIIICERSDQADTFIDFSITPAGQSAVKVGRFHCDSENTFIFDNPFVLDAGDVLSAVGASAAGTAQYDLWITFIDQDWS
tara:strand:+ start:117 stop:479 length:363 start_codon:yes stop_codon:yes gene_type:complete